MKVVSQTTLVEASPLKRVSVFRYFISYGKMEAENELVINVSLREQAKNDITRFAKFHSWYKHLSYEGDDFLIFPWKGQQPRNVLDIRVEDEEGLHWWVWRADFIDEIPIDGIGKDIIMRRPVKLNCFLRGLDGEEPNRHLRGWYIIQTKNPDIEEDLKRTYPDLMAAEEYAITEHSRQIYAAVSTAKTIYNLMKRACPEWIGVDPDLSLGDSFDSSEADTPEKTVYIAKPVTRKPLRRAQSEGSGLRHHRASPKLERKRSVREFHHISLGGLRRHRKRKSKSKLPLPSQ